MCKFDIACHCYFELNIIIRSIWLLLTGQTGQRRNLELRQMFVFYIASESCHDNKIAVLFIIFACVSRCNNEAVSLKMLLPQRVVGGYFPFPFIKGGPMFPILNEIS